MRHRWTFHHARDVLEEAFARAHPDSTVLVGRCTRLGAGISRTAFRAPVGVRSGNGSLAGDWVALLATSEDPDVAERQASEVTALGEARTSGFPFRVPEVLAAWTTEDGAAVLVERFVEGLPLDFQAQGRDRAEGMGALRLTARVAAAIHAVPTALRGPDTRRAFALAKLARLDDLTPDLRARAAAWADAHLPTDEPTGLVHGDLLAQNLRVGLDAWTAAHAGEPVTDVGVIDWEYACRGDPAWDLAVVTRAVARPFGDRDGVARLVDAWHAAGGVGVQVDHVRLYELALVAGWAADGIGDGPLRLEALLRRLGV